MKNFFLKNAKAAAVLEAAGLGIEPGVQTFNWGYGPRDWREGFVVTSQFSRRELWEKFGIKVSSSYFMGMF